MAINTNFNLDSMNLSGPIAPTRPVTEDFTGLMPAPLPTTSPDPTTPIDPRLVTELDASITTPKLPEGAEAAPILQQLTSEEIQQLQTLGATPELLAKLASAPEPIDAAQITAATVGEQAPQAETIQAQVGPESLVQAQQIAEVDQAVAQGELSQQAQAAQIVPSDDFKIQAATGVLSEEAQAQAVIGQASDEFLAATAALSQELINTPVDPRSTMREQYNQLMDFSPGEIPAWGKGALRTAMQAMSNRGITGSTIMGEAVTSALMQAALPIASQDAKVFQTWNLSILDKTAQAGILKATHLANIDIKNLDFKNNAAAQNAQAALQIDIKNLDNEQQARILNAQNELALATTNTGFQQQANIQNAQASLQMDVTNLDSATKTAIVNAQNSLQVKVQNLNARQQSAVENAKAFLQTDMANLSYANQTAIVNSQSRLQSLMSDTSAINASRQFNATSENQTNQFFAEMSGNISTFNAQQSNTVGQFNKAMLDAREQFNTKNALIIDQANVQYQRQINTANTATENQFNLINAQNLLNISNTAMANKIMLMRDKNNFLFTASENQQERALRMSIANLSSTTSLNLLDNKQSFQASNSLGNFAYGIASDLAGNVLDKVFEDDDEG